MNAMSLLLLGNDEPCAVFLALSATLYPVNVN